MPQRNLLNGSIIVTSMLMLLSARLILATPINYQDEDDQYLSSQSQEQEDQQFPESTISRHSVNKRSFYDIHCKGIYDKSIFARVDQICEDCYNLFREPKLHTLCRQNCFTSEYFKGCVDVLLLTDEIDNIQEWIRRLNGLGV